MADFATPTPGQPDSPYFWAKPTSEPKPNISGEIKGKAAASALQEGVQGVNAAYEKGIQNTIYNAVDPLRDQYMERLHSADSILQGHQTPDPLGRDAPRDVKGLPNTLGTLDSARANGKLSQTDYDARLTALAKEVRGKYPGYREYVDETFKRITGRDSANQYIKSVIGDIDSYMSSRKSEGEKLYNRAISPEAMNYEGANIWAQKLKDNPDKYGPGFLSWLNEHKAKDHALEMGEKTINAAKAMDSLDKEQKDRITNQAVTESGAHYYAAALDTIATHMDIDPKTNDRMNDILQRDRRGESIRDVKPEEAVQLRTFLEQQKAGLTSSRSADLARSFPDLKTEEISRIVQAEMKDHYDPYMEALGKGDFSTAETVKNVIKARTSQSSMESYNDPKWGKTLQWLAGLKEIDPQLANAVGMQIGVQYGQEKVGEFAKAAASAASPPPDGPRPFSKIAAELQAKGVKDGRTWKSMIELYGTIANKGPQAISNESADSLINSAFGPESGDVLKYFANEGSGHGKNLGQQYVYNTFTSEGMIDRIAKRAKENPELYEHYRNWVGSNIRYLLADHSTLTAVAPEQTGRISTVQQALGERPEVKSHYNDESNTFSFTTGKGSVNRPDLTALSNTLKRAAEVTKGDPNHQMDPTVAVYQMLQSMHAPEGSLVDDMLEAMRTARNKE